MLISSTTRCLIWSALSFPSWSSIPCFIHILMLYLLVLIWSSLESFWSLPPQLGISVPTIQYIADSMNIRHVGNNVYFIHNHGQRRGGDDEGEHWYREYGHYGSNLTRMNMNLPTNNNNPPHISSIRIAHMNNGQDAIWLSHYHRDRPSMTTFQ